MKYKLTDKNGKTQSGQVCETQWGEGVTHTATGQELELCTDGVIHYYDDPYLAILMNPVHGNYDEETMQLWEVETEGKTITDGRKSGAKTVTTMRRIAKPTLSTRQRMEIAIRCALEVYHEKAFREWATRWLSGADRSEEAALATANDTQSASYAAQSAWYAAQSVSYIAQSASDIAQSASYIALTAAQFAGYAAQSASYAAQFAAQFAGYAARVARSTAQSAKSATKAADFSITEKIYQAIKELDAERLSEMGKLEGEK